MRYLLISLAVLILQCACTNNPAKVSTPSADLNTNIIPQPLSLVKGDGGFTIGTQTIICCDEELTQAADYLRLYLPIEQSNGIEENSIRLILDKKLGHEEYSLEVDNSGVEIRGGDYGGVFNGIQSLLQLLPNSCWWIKPSWAVILPSWSPWRSALRNFSR